MKTYTSKEISELIDLPIPTLRYYEQIGLLDPVERAENGHRRYQERDVLRIGFLKRVRATGMSISEMQYYVELYRQGDSTLAERRQILADHRARILAEIDALHDTVDFLEMKLARYDDDLASLENQSTLETQS